MLEIGECEDGFELEDGGVDGQFAQARAESLAGGDEKPGGVFGEFQIPELEVIFDNVLHIVDGGNHEVYGDFGGDVGYKFAFGSVGRAGFGTSGKEGEDAGR